MVRVLVTLASATDYILMREPPDPCEWAPGAEKELRSLGTDGKEEGRRRGPSLPEVGGESPDKLFVLILWDVSIVLTHPNTREQSETRCST